MSFSTRQSISSMLFTIVIFLLFGFIHQLDAIQCYTCNEGGFYCPMPLYFDAGDESNENTIDTAGYDPSYSCMSAQSWNPSTGETKVILRGIKDCEEVDEANHRVNCCFTNYCNKHLPAMHIKTLTDIMPADATEISSTKRHLASLLSITMLLIGQYLLVH
ncbi:unnamed protein product [Adineta ricciae]|uniref:Uncharacterized protein n=1 Tax=Adineta ricciae TaxID=249248 RepID=A0A815CW42_ADIRI|nr:unnamed protein product [Adineta ricciae]